MNTFSPKDPAEQIFYSTDFSALLSAGETLSTATASLRVTSGTDAAPSAMLSGLPVITGSIVSQLVIGGVAGSTYLLGISVTTSTGQVFVEAAQLDVLERD